MKSDIIYVEKINGSNHDGCAWIGKCFYSKSGLSIYFDGKGFKREKNFSSNYYDLDTGEEYWISKVKKNGEDRHRFGKGIIQIDKNVIEEYLQIVKKEKLEKNKFSIVELNNIPAKEKATKIENEKSDYEDFNNSLRFKDVKTLTVTELESVIAYYNNFDLSDLYKKSRKGFKLHRQTLEIELKKRNNLKLV